MIGMKFGICQCCGGVATQTCSYCGGTVCIKCNSKMGCKNCQATKK